MIPYKIYYQNKIACNYSSNQTWKNLKIGKKMRKIQIILNSLIPIFTMKSSPNKN